MKPAIFTSKNILRLATVILIIAFTLIVLYHYLPVGLDWQDAYLPSSLAMLRGESPYEVGNGFYNAPYTLIPFLPFALMPYRIGRVGVFIMGLIGFAYIIRQAGAKPPAMIIFLTSAPVIGCLNNGNLDWMPMLGLLMPVKWGLIFASMKPQVGIGLAIYWLWESWRKGGAREVFRNFSPVTGLLLLSFAVYGFWITRISGMPDNINNLSIFPYGLVFGILFLRRSIIDKDKKQAMASSPFLAPYVSQFSWAAVLPAFIASPRKMVCVSILLWLPVLYRYI